MILLQVTIHINTPELAANHALSQSLDVCMSQESLGEIHFAIVNTILQFDAKLPRQIIVSIDETFIV